MEEKKEAQGLPANMHKLLGPGEKHKPFVPASADCYRKRILTRAVHRLDPQD